jgi:hypothetical protein
MKSVLRAVVALCVLTAWASPALAGQVKLDIRDGLITLSAKDATLREILTEWARVGQTKVLNAERAPSTPLTIELNGVPEAVALKTLLRSAAGYVAAPKTAAQTGPSTFALIMVMPGTRPAATTTAATSTPAPAAAQPNTQPLWGRDRPLPQPSVVIDDQDDAVQPMIQPGMMGRGQLGAGQPGTQQNPAGGGSGTASPYGMNPYGMPAAPSGGTQGGQSTGTGSNSASRPGMPTTPPPPPSPIKQ